MFEPVGQRGSRQPLASTYPSACEHQLEVASDFLATRRARRFSAVTLDDLGVHKDAQWAPLLVVSELVTNVVRHGGPTMLLTVGIVGPDLRIEVTDNDAGGSAAGTPALMPGHGLDIVDTLAVRWGVATADPSKTVWCDLPLD